MEIQKNCKRKYTKMFLQYSVCVLGVFATLASGRKKILCCRTHLLVASIPQKVHSFTFEVCLPLSFQSQSFLSYRKIPGSLCAHLSACAAMLFMGCPFSLGCTVATQSFSLHTVHMIFFLKRNVNLQRASQMLSLTLRFTGIWLFW